MPEPFNFNTPITENTNLVARYRCGSAPYAGKWFRITTVGGKQYVPVSLEEAEATASTVINENNTVSLLNTATGIKELIKTDDFYKIELSGGWRKFGDDFFGINYKTYDHRCNIRYVTGYPQGLNFSTDIKKFFAIPESYASSRYESLNIDVTGLKFDQPIFNGFYYLNRSTWTVCGGIMGLFHSISLQNSGDGGGVFGDVEPLFSPSTISYKNHPFDAGFASFNNKSLNYTKGIGFVGQYAQEWVEAFPTSNSYPYRTTYLA